MQRIDKTEVAMLLENSIYKTTVTTKSLALRCL